MRPENRDRSRLGGEVLERTPAGAFDALATDYDAHFTATPLGRLLRQAVHRRLDARFAPGDRILDLACGTGEDAVHLGARGVRVLAIDASPAMVEAARSKAAVAGVEERVEIRVWAIEELSCFSEEVSEKGPALSSPGAEDPGLPTVVPTGTSVRSGPGGTTVGSPGFQSRARGGFAIFNGGFRTSAGLFDGAFSSFGGLNCVADLSAVASTLSGLLRPGAPVLLCVMGPLVPWEWLGLLLRCRPAQAFRRLRPSGVPWRGITVRYPSIRALRRAFAPAFRLTRVSAVGALLPTTEWEGWARRHPRLLASLARCERRLETVPPLPWLADHYLAELERTA